MTVQEPIVIDDVMPVEVPVTIAGQSCVLKEASGEAAIRYRNTRAKCTRFQDGKFAGVDGDIADAIPRLVSDCLFKVVTLPDGKTIHSKVEEKIVRGWPDRIQTALVKRIKEISPSLDESPDDETIEGLEKQISGLQERLAKLKAERDSLGNSSSGTVGG